MEDCEHKEKCDNHKDARGVDYNCANYGSCCFKEKAKAPRPQDSSGSNELTGCVFDLGKIAELGQAYAQFELIRTMATEAQTRYGKHLELCDVERMGDIAKDANEIMAKLMAAFDRAK